MLKKLWELILSLFEEKKTTEVKKDEQKEDVKKPENPKPEPVISTPQNPDWEWIADRIKLDELSKEKMSELEGLVKKIFQNKEKYISVYKKTKVPPELIAAIHYKESSFRFDRMLHNGEPLNIKSRIVPIGVGPFATWEEAAIDALKREGSDNIAKWTLAQCLAFAEKYNGKGYRKRGIYSNYVCGFTNFSSEKGGYPRDHVWDPEYKYNRFGVAAILFGIELFAEKYNVDIDTVIDDKEEKPNASNNEPIIEKPNDMTDITKFSSWMKIAEKELGQKEIVGAKDNPRVVEYHQVTSLKATDDETPWCASFVSWCFEKVDIKSTKSARAKSYAESSDFIKVDKPVYGCVCVYTREGGGHVHFYVKQDNSKIFGLGGNQSNAVNIAGYDKSRLLGYYWPKAKLDDYKKALAEKNA